MLGQTVSHYRILEKLGGGGMGVCIKLRTPLGRVLRARGNSDEAERKLQEAVAIQRELGEKSHVYINSMQLAELAIEQGQPAKPEALVREVAKDSLEDDQRADPGTFELLGRALLAEGMRAEAAKAVTRASALLGRTQRQDVQFAVEITAARVLAASGNRSDATQGAKSLDATIARARRLGFLGYEFEARLALAEIEMKSGSTAAGRAHLGALEKEARAKGFDRVARKAGTLAPREEKAEGRKLSSLLSSLSATCDR